MRILRSFVRTADTISEWSGKAVAVLLPFAVVVIIYEVVSRYFFESPTTWGHELSIFFYGYCGAIAGAYVLKHHRHITVDVIYARQSPRVKAILDSVTALIFFYFVTLVIYKGWEQAMAALAIDLHSGSVWNVSLVHFRFLIPASGFLLILQGMANWGRTLYFAITNEELQL